MCGVGRGHRIGARGVQSPGVHPARQMGRAMVFLLWIIAVILVIAGIVSLFRGQVLWGAALIVIGLLVGPGGVSIFT